MNCQRAPPSFSLISFKLQIHMQYVLCVMWCVMCDVPGLFLADPAKARGCSINSLVINSLINWFRQPFPPTALRRRHAQSVWDSTSSYKVDILIKNSPNHEGYPNLISGSKVMAILLKRWILPIGGASSGVKEKLII